MQWLKAVKICMISLKFYNKSGQCVTWQGNYFPAPRNVLWFVRGKRGGGREKRGAVLCFFWQQSGIRLSKGSAFSPSPCEIPLLHTHTHLLPPPLHRLPYAKKGSGLQLTDPRQRSKWRQLLIPCLFHASIGNPQYFYRWGLNGSWNETSWGLLCWRHFRVRFFSN